MENSLPDPVDGKLRLGGFGLLPSLPIPTPPSFADFRFTVIGREPELLKRISGPQPDFQYNDDRTSPTPSFRYPSETPEPSLSHSTLFRALSVSNDHNSAYIAFEGNEMSVDDSPRLQTESKQAGRAQSPPSNNAPTSHTSFTGNVSKPVPHGPKLLVSPPAQSSINAASQEELSQIPNYDNRSSNTVNTASTNNLDTVISAQSKYTSLRGLQIRLMSALDNLHIPDNSDALLLVQAAQTHSTNALATAHRSQTIAQQAVASAREAASAAEESLVAAEKAKEHACDAVAAVERIGGAQSAKSGWEWKTIVSGLQNDLQTLGEWLGEREKEEAAERQKAERMEKEKEKENQDKMSVDDGLRVATGGLSPRTIQTLVDEVVRRTKEEARSQSVSIGARDPSPIQQQLHRTAELEADDVRRAWSTGHEHSPKSSLVTTETTLGQQTVPEKVREQEEQAAQESPVPIKQTELELQKQEEDARVQREQREAEIKAQRVRELELQKLEVAKFRILERERQARQEDERKTADALRRRLAIGEQKLKVAKAAEAKRVAEAQRLKAQLEEQEKRSSMQAAAIRVEITTWKEGTKEAEAKATELKAAKAKAAEEEAARAAEAREIELREVQIKRRQEVMAQKQRASAEEAARILAERARERGEKSKSPVQSRISPKTLFHPLPSPVFQDASLPSLHTPNQHEARESNDKAVSVGVRLGASEDSTISSSPDTTSEQRPQKTGRPIPLPLPIPRPKNPTKPPMASSTSTTSTTGSTGLPESASNRAAEVPSVHRRSQDPGNLPIIPGSQLPPTSPEAHAANLRFVRNENGLSQDAYTPLESADNRVKSEAPLVVKPPTSPPGAAKRKSTEEASPGTPKRAKVKKPKVKKNTTPKQKLEEPLSPTLPLTSVPPPLASIVPIPSTQTPNAISPSSQTTGGSNATIAPIPPRLKPVLPNFRTRKPTGSSIDSSAPAHDNISNPTPQSSEPTRTSPPESQAPKGLLDTTAISNTPNSVPIRTHPETSVEYNRNLTTAPDAHTKNPDPQQQNAPDSFQGSTVVSDIHAPITNPLASLSPDHDSSQIAPTIHSGGGWDAPAQGDGEQHFSSSRGRRRYVSRNDDHYSPPTRTPPRSISPLRRYQPQEGDTYRGSGYDYSTGPSRRPDLYIATNKPLSRSRTPPPRTYSPRSPRSPHIGQRRRWIDDELPSHSYRQGGEERDRPDRMFRPHSPVRFTRRSLTPERPGDLYSRVGALDPKVYKFGGGQSYIPGYSSDLSSSQPRWVSDTYRPSNSVYGGYEQDYGSSRSPLPGYDSYIPAEYTESERPRPDLLDRMSIGASARGKGTSVSRGSSRGRGRGGRPLEQRISSTSKRDSPMALMNRLEA